MDSSKNEIGTDTELVTEALVEEVSIDGMCGVY
jgi:mycofactocin precursor